MISIKCENITKSYGKKIIFSNFSYAFEYGKVYLLVGFNGKGKTTFLNVILSLIKYDKGHIDLYNNRVSYAFDNMPIPDDVTVDDFLNMMKKIKRDEGFNKEYYYQFYGLTEYQRFKLKNLSKGNLEKVMIINTLIGEANIYIYDEAMSGLDVIYQKKFVQMIRELKKNNKTIIIVSHQKDYLEEIIDCEVSL